MRSRDSPSAAFARRLNGLVARRAANTDTAEIGNLPDARPFHLRGNYAPVPDELTDYDLPVEGAIPPELIDWRREAGPMRERLYRFLEAGGYPVLG